MGKISIEVATGEFNNWLDSKRIKANVREEKKVFGDIIIEGICDGDLVLNDNIFEYKLLFPLGEKEEIKTITFKHKLKVKELSVKLKGYNPEDVDGRISAHVEALTGENKAIIGNFDTEDYKLCKAIAMYFL